VEKRDWERTASFSSSRSSAWRAPSSSYFSFANSSERYWPARSVSATAMRAMRKQDMMAERAVKASGRPM